MEELNDSATIESEEDVKVRLVNAWLQENGFDLRELSFEHTLTLRLGRGLHEVNGRDRVHGRYDVLVRRGDENLLLVETKGPNSLLIFGGLSAVFRPVLGSAS